MTLRSITGAQLEVFQRCPRCSYKELVRGASPAMPLSTRSETLDQIRRTFEKHRANGTMERWVTDRGVEVLPFIHQDLERWRHVRGGIRRCHDGTGMEVVDRIEDLWQSRPNKEIIVVSYSFFVQDEYPYDGRRARLRADEAANRRAEICQWLLRGNGLTVSSTAYFVQYVGGGRNDRSISPHLREHVGDPEWIDQAIERLRDMVRSEELPPKGAGCIDDECGAGAGRSSSSSRVEDTLPKNPTGEPPPRPGHRFRVMGIRSGGVAGQKTWEFIAHARTEEEAKELGRSAMKSSEWSKWKHEEIPVQS